jgi:hypothetical protein
MRGNLYKNHNPFRVVLPRGHSSQGMYGYHRDNLPMYFRSHRRATTFHRIQSSSDDTSDDDGKKVSIDLNSLEGASRRSMLVGFTCDACGGRTERLVNPLAWAKGMVIVQCEHCKAWHKIADANNMVEEYRFDSSDDE